MKVRFGVLILLFVCPATAFSHAEIFFPRLFTPAELPNTGFVLLNVDPEIATVNFYLLSANGVVVASPAAIQIAPGGQLAKLGSELFATAATVGWVYAITDTEGMQAFWLNYDSGLTFLDGAEAAVYDTIGPDQIVPLVAGETELNVISLNGVTVPVTVRLFGDAGELAGAFTRNIPIAGGFQLRASEMFPGVDLAGARYLRIRTPGAPVAVTALIKKFQVPSESAVVNGINAGLTEMVFPHVVNGVLTDANYTTMIGVTNLSNSSQIVTLTFYPDDAPPVVATRSMAPNGALRETIATLFQLQTQFVAGWVRVSGAAPVAGFASYSDSVGGGLAVVPAGTAQSSLFFSHIANGAPQWQTGLALLNVGVTAANVEIFAVNPSGSLIGSTTISLGAGKKLAKVIHELIPETLGVNGGYVYVRADGGSLHGIELFYTRDLKVLSNVAAGRLVGGVRYVPPSR